MARPTKYSQELVDKICEQLAQGDSMRTVTKADDMPAMSTIFRWLRENPEFQEQYARAKEEAADAFIEDMQDIADDGTNDWMERYDKDGEMIGWQLNGEHVQRSRLRIDTRKWIASKLKPKKYGDKLDLTSAGEKITPILGGNSVPGDDSHTQTTEAE